jgi:hypothetical protein
VIFVWSSATIDPGPSGLLFLDRENDDGDHVHGYLLRVVCRFRLPPLGVFLTLLGRRFGGRFPSAISEQFAGAGTRLEEEDAMAKDHGSSVKDDKQYEGLRKKGMSKERAAKIANASGSSKKGGGERLATAKRARKPAGLPKR